MRGNAIRHGLYATIPVIPGESVKHWEAHRACVLESLAPVGYQEAVLAERAALLSWRLRRVAAFEATAIAVEQRQHTEKSDLSKLTGEELEIVSHLLRRASLGGDDSAPSLAPGKLDAFHQTTRRRQRLLERVSEMPDEAKLDAAEGWDILNFIARLAGAHRADRRNLRLPDSPDGMGRAPADGWTAGILRQRIAAIVMREAKSEAAVQSGNGGQGPAGSGHLSAGDRDRPSQDRMRLDLERLEKVARYEGHLSRQHFQTLHELEALQARRRGQAAPLARLDVHGLPYAS